MSDDERATAKPQGLGIAGWWKVLGCEGPPPTEEESEAHAKEMEVQLAQLEWRKAGEERRRRKYG